MSHARLGFVGLLLAASACAAPRIMFPSGPSEPVPDAAAIWTSATEACRGAQTFSAEIQVNGNIGTEKLRRATLQGAMTRSGEIALLAVAPAGPPIFNLAGRAERATLTLPHDRRVLVAPAVDIVEALIGLRLAPADWLDLLSGCVAGAAGETGTRVNGATIITLGGSAGRVRVEQAGATWQIIAGERPDLLVEYPQFLGRWPSAAKLTSHPGAAIHVVLNMTIGQIFVNTPLQARLFAPGVAADYRPMTLDELRAIGPLGAGGSATQTAGR